jgi:ribosomal-protein-alanine N-acetyltransferase
MNGDLTLDTARLLLRDFAEDDLADVHAFRGDPEVARLMDFGPETLEQTRAWLDGAIHHNRARPRRAYNLAVVRRADARVIGWLGFGESSRYPAGSGRFGAGYALAREAWGQGFAAEALRAAIDHCFAALGARRVSAWCWADNLASARVMEKTGMRFEGHSERVEPKTGMEMKCLEYAIEPHSSSGSSSASGDGANPARR